ncbi:acetyl-coenzyme A synthetase [Cutibacterium acnes JCM 18920]|nr:acetyl-coenzyme A synthetase [Cutibacterium acnes JCM 18920]
MANVLKVMGVRKGDVVTIYLPRIPEIFFAMLACAKIRAVHSVFSPTVENVIVVRNTKTEVSMDSTRDHWYDELCKLPIAKGKCETVQVDTEDPLFILYTSGFTGKPKAIVHTHGGYQVGTYITLKQYFDIKEEDRWWCTADPGWINGHSYLVYGPLLNGATVFMHEGGPTYPYPDGWWQLIEHYGITSFYTAPTAIRTLMRFGDAGCANTICPVCAYSVRLASPSTRRLGAASTMWSVTARVRSPIPGGRPKLACSRSPLCRRCRSNQVPLGVRLLLSTRRAMRSLRAKRASSSPSERVSARSDCDRICVP